ncbi:MAG: TIGR04282 family arsenosugar biosynthesis glycosyltransferase [Flavobacteriaceae bacterium]
MKNEKNLLLIFTRNPELGKCKTRLAKTIGDEAALEIYKFLLQHTVSITENIPFDMEVHYSGKMNRNDIWDNDIYIKKQQIEGDLGEKMQHAFLSAFKNGYRNVIIIGSDLYDITQEDLEEAFKSLETFEFVLGPSEDGGYYLLGMNLFKPELFKNKSWGTDTVLRDTLVDLKDDHLQLLEERNDIDIYEDIKDEPVFQQFLKKTN